MANIASQIKRNRQTVKLHARNQAVRSELKTRIKKAVETAATGDAAAKETAFRAAQKRIDTAVSKGVVHKRTAARRKSRLAKRINASA
jgi:small subunit ribosomal protein S20